VIAGLTGEEVSFLLLRAVTAGLCLASAALSAQQALRDTRRRPMRQLRAWLGAAVVLGIGVLALHGLPSVIGPGTPPLIWRSWAWALTDLVVPLLYGTVVLTTRRRDALEEELARPATQDALADLPNRRGFADTALAALAAAARNGQPVSGAMMDIYRFKRINDGWGHDAGDVVLRGAATALRGALRPGDVLARVGGEEFALVPPGVTPEEALPLVERLSAAVTSAAPHPGAPEFQVTLSAGIAAMQGTGLPAIEDGLRAADAALYAAKEAGRDRAMLG
jgi:diguanylate cyclase (GGDEF)-like protein